MPFPRARIQIMEKISRATFFIIPMDSIIQGTSTFFLKIWEIPKFWEISQILKKFGEIWENWSKTDQGDFLRLLDARDCSPVD